MAISKNRKKRIRKRQRLQAEAEVCNSETVEAGACGSSETSKDGREEQTLDGDQAPDVDLLRELREELRQVRGDLLLLSKSNKGFLIQLRRAHSSNAALQKKLDDKSRMFEKEQEFNAALVDGFRQIGTRTCTEASGRYETVACWEYLEREPDSWRRYLPDAEQSIEEALTISGSGFRCFINFSAMTQTNVETRKMRAIRRREIPLHADAVLKMTTETQHLRGENQHLNAVLRKKADEIHELEDDFFGQAKTLQDHSFNSQLPPKPLDESARSWFTPQIRISAFKCEVQPGWVDMNEYLLYHGDYFVQHRANRYPTHADVAQDEVNPDDRTAELQAIHQAFQKDKRSYCDESFPPTKQGRVSRWCRPHEIGAHDDRILWRREDWQLFRGTPSADDVQQGELGDCWFLSSLAAMAEFQGGRLVQRLLPDQRQFSRAGAYLVRLWLGGRWRDVIVDDRLPCIGNGFGTYTQLAYCATGKCQLWASIIEKGFAKACGSYEALAGGEAEEALTILTGWPCEAIQFEKEEFDADILWATVCTSRDAKFLMTVSTRSNKSRSEEDIRAAGLVPNHAYSLIDVFDVLDSRGDRLRLLKIRNPHAKDRWRGSWSETSHLWTPELREQLGCQKASQAGMFFMCFGDFLRWFERCTICKVRSDGWHKVRMPTELPGSLVLPSSGWLLTVSETTECCLTVAQPQDRAKPGPLFRSLNLGPIVVAGFVLVEASSPQKLSVAAVGHPRSRAVVSADCWLKPGVSYFLLPLSLHENTVMPVVFSCFSRKAVQIKEHTFSESAVLASWGAFIKSSDPSPDNFHGAKVYTAKSGGGMVACMAENHSRGHFAAELTFNSIEDGKLLFSRRSGITKDWVAPGQAQILQVVLPQGWGGGWRSNQRYEMRFVRSGQALNTPDLGFGCAKLHKPFSLYAGQAKAGGQAREVLNKWLPW
ncbi:sol [Symbiodinium sp. CCMP2592]|nr:sol [Symbiodinium sp. CCMP2592]